MKIVKKSINDIIPKLETYREFNIERQQRNSLLTTLNDQSNFDSSNLLGASYQSTCFLLL